MKMLLEALDYLGSQLGGKLRPLLLVLGLTMPILLR